MVKRKVYSYEVIEGTHGKARVYRFLLEGCNHITCEPFSRGIPRSGMVMCPDCTITALIYQGLLPVKPAAA